MKAVRKVSMLLLIATAAAAYVWLRFAPEIPSAAEPVAVPVAKSAAASANNIVIVEVPV